MVNTKDLSGVLLDYYVAQILGVKVSIINGECVYVGAVDTWAMPGSYKGILTGQRFNPTTRHGIGGLIMDREGISTVKHLHTDQWKAYYENGASAWGPTRLVAAMRVFAVQHLVSEVPETTVNAEVVLQLGSVVK